MVASANDARCGVATTLVAREAAEKEIDESVVSSMNAKQIAQGYNILTIKSSKEWQIFRIFALRKEIKSRHRKY